MTITYLKARGPSCLLLFIFSLSLLGCTQAQRVLSARVFEPNSHIQGAIINKSNSASAQQWKNDSLLWTYVEHIGPMLFSQCHNFPSDSEYLRLMEIQECSVFLALPASIGRMLRENDLAMLSKHTPFVSHKHLTWPDFSYLCTNSQPNFLSPY